MKRKRQPKSASPSALVHLSLSHGKRVRLSRLLYGRGLANGTLMVLPLDQAGGCSASTSPERIEPSGSGGSSLTRGNSSVST